MTTITDAAAYEAYEAAADVYDAFTAHHRYEEWTALLESHARRHGLRAPGRMLDLGCGTGKSFLPWLDRGWSVVGCDGSPAMLRHAAAKAPAGVRLVEADARDLAVLGEFELVAMVDDVLNYIAPDDHVAVFEGVARNLAPGGLFVFDVNTLRTFREFFGTTETVETEDTFIVWRGGATEGFEHGDTVDAIMDAFVRTENGCWERRRGVHRQYHHPLDRLDAALAAAGLERLGVYGQDTEGNAEPRLVETRHTKAVIVAGA